MSCTSTGGVTLAPDFKKAPETNILAFSPNSLFARGRREQTGNRTVAARNTAPSGPVDTPDLLQFR